MQNAVFLSQPNVFLLKKRFFWLNLQNVFENFPSFERKVPLNNRIAVLTAPLKLSRSQSKVFFAEPSMDIIF